MVGRRAAAGAAAFLLQRLKLQKERYEGTCLWRKLEKMKLVPQQAEDVQPGSVQIVLNPEDLKKVQWEDDVNAAVFRKLSELEKGTDCEAFLKKVSDMYGAGLASQLHKDGIPKTVGDFEVDKASLQKLIDEQINEINAVMERLDKLKEANQDGNGEKLIYEQINEINAVMERFDKLKEANQDGNWEKLIEEQIIEINAVMERLDKLMEANQDGNGEENGGGGQSS